MRAPLTTVATLIAALTLCAATARAEPDAPPKDLIPILKPILERSKAPALAAAVYRDGKLIASGVTGLRSIDEKDPATAADLFPILSCSKNFARIVLMRLAERGLLSLDAPLSKLLDGVPMRPEYRDVTLADLMAHKAGIQPYTNIGPRLTPFLFELKGPAREQRAAFTAHVLDEAPSAPPRTRFVYSNAGFCVLATIAERAAKQDWEQLVAAEAFKPLGLNSATGGGEGVQLRGHMRTPNGPRVAPSYPRLPVMLPAGGVSLTINDFAAFAAAEADLEAGRSVAGLTEKTMKRVPELRAADAPTGDRPGTMYFGGDGHYHAAFAIWPKERAAIAVACNYGESDELCTEIAAAIRAAILPDLEPGDTAAGQRPGPARQTATGGPGNGGPSAPTGAAPNGPRYGFNIRNENGVMTVGEVAPDSIAEKAGLKSGDEILKLNGQPAADLEEQKLRDLIRDSTLTLTIRRAGKESEISMRK